jgi:hypothetical protein
VLELRCDAASETRRLLRVLLVRLGQVPADADRGSVRMSGSRSPGFARWFETRESGWTVLVRLMIGGGAWSLDARIAARCEPAPCSV